MLTVLALTYVIMLVAAPAMRFRGLLAATLTIAVVEVWSHMGFTFGSLGAFEALPFMLVAACIVAELRNYAKRRSRRHLLTLFAVGTFLLALAAWAFGTSALLPTHDPSAVPTFARLIRDHGRVPDTQAPIDGRAWYYPPGFAVLLACFNWMRPLATLWIFKGVAIAVLALTPLTWSLTLRRIVTRPVPLISTIAATTFGFFLFDRTVILAPAFAGKNSQLLASALAPIALELLLTRRREPKALPLTMAVVAGLVLIHFSMLYVLAALLVLWALTRRRLRLVYLATVGLPLLSAALIALPRMLAALEVHPDVRSAPTPFMDSLWNLLHELTARRSPGLFIFEEPGWPYKGPVVLAIALAATLVFVIARGNHLRRPAFVTLMACLAVVGLLAVFTGTLPMPLHPDFTRWFLYNFVALVGASAFMLVLRILHDAKSHVPWSTIATAGIAASLLLEAGLARWADLTTDLGVLTATSRRERVSNRELGRVARQLANLSSRGCALVTSGTSTTGGRVVQEYKPFEYVSALSSCYIANGSWLTLGSGLQPGCDGVASEACARAAMRLHPSDDVYLVELPAETAARSGGVAPLGPYVVRLMR